MISNWCRDTACNSCY